MNKNALSLSLYFEGLFLKLNKTVCSRICCTLCSRLLNTLNFGNDPQTNFAERNVCSGQSSRDFCSRRTYSMIFSNFRNDVNFVSIFNKFLNPKSQNQRSTFWLLCSAFRKHQIVISQIHGERERILLKWRRSTSKEHQRELDRLRTLLHHKPKMFPNNVEKVAFCISRQMPDLLYSIQMNKNIFSY